MFYRKRNIEVNQRLMRASTSEKGRLIAKDLHTNYDPENELYYHKWEIPANTVGTMSSPNIKVIPGDLGAQDATLAIRPKIVRPLSALSVKKSHYNNNKQRPASASSFVFTLHHFTPSVVVDKKPED